MGWIDWTLTILTLIVGIILTIVVMLQTSKTSGSVVSGDSNNTFYGANKSKTLDGVLAKYTVGLAIVFIILCIVTTISIIK